MTIAAETVEETKTCARCDKALPIEEFTLDKKNGTRKTWCKPCRGEYSRSVRAAKRAAAEAEAAARPGLDAKAAEKALERALLDLAASIAMLDIRATEDASDDWRHRAACRGMYGDIWFPVGNTGPALVQIEAAKRVCFGCPVRSECLDEALESGQDAGVWGGMSEDERRALKRKAARNRARASA